MRLLRRAKSVGVLCGLGGVLVVLCLLWLAGFFATAAEAQAPAAAEKVTVPADMAVPPVPTPGSDPVSGTYPASTAATPPATTPANVNRASEPPNIDQLVQQLQRLRAKKAELDRQEKKVVAALKDKLKEQKQTLEKLGLQPEEPPSPPPPEVRPDTNEKPRS
jgi:hypothetical protein